MEGRVLPDTSRKSTILEDGFQFLTDHDYLGKHLAQNRPFIVHRIDLAALVPHQKEMDRSNTWRLTQQWQWKPAWLSNTEE